MRHLAKAMWLLLVVAVVLSPASSYAQKYPSRAVHVIVGFAAGGASDIVARIAAQGLNNLWKQPVVVENRTGASGTLAADIVAKSAPDGYTMLISSPTSTAAATGMFPHLPYNVTKDFVAVTVIATTPFILVVPNNSPLKNFKEFVAFAKAKTTEVNYGSGGLGSQGHLAAELLNQSLGIKMTHVPYKGEAAAISDVISGRLNFMFLTLSAAQPFLHDGKLRGLAVSSLKRSEFAPQYPTVSEEGITGFETESWNAIYVPSSMSKALVDQINADTLRVLHEPGTLALFKKQGMSVIANSSEQATAYLRAETEKWGNVIKKANFRNQ